MKKMTFSGDYIFVPFFEAHDYALLPSTEFSVQYYTEIPNFVKNYPFLVSMNLPKVCYSFSSFNDDTKVNLILYKTLGLSQVKLSWI